MLETLKNAFKSKEIRIKILLTLALIVVYRIGCYIPVPSLNAGAVTGIFGGNDFFNVLGIISGGSMANATLFTLGILPFINSFIIMQLLTLVIPALERMSKEGEEGRKKITQITRIVAIILAVIQAIGIVVTLYASGGENNAIRPLFPYEEGAEGAPILTMAITIVMMVGGSTMVMWLSERITEYAIGNGTSIIIFIGILSTAGTSLAGAFKQVGDN